MGKMINTPKASILDTLTQQWRDRKRFWLETYNIQSEIGRENSRIKSRFKTGEEEKRQPSIFDPVLCETIYQWFAVPSGSILDPFAGGSVRGIVAEEMGYKYTGIDLSKEQIEANKKQSDKPKWINGNSLEILPTLNEDFDFLFSCPPYFDLEVYSEDKEKDFLN
jgi:DNA modification methylase